MVNLLFSTLVPLAGTLLVFSEIQVTSANKTVPCDKTGCKDHEVCDKSTGKCTDDCMNDPCNPGYYCNDYGKCIKDICPPSHPCDPGMECYLEHVQCFTAPCPPIPSCRPTNKCASITCPQGEVCENEKCVDSSCATILCLTGTICYKGACFEEISCDGKCNNSTSIPQKCYEGSVACPSPPCPKEVICRPDKCAVVRCVSKCIDGQCVP